MFADLFRACMSDEIFSVAQKRQKLVLLPKAGKAMVTLNMGKAFNLANWILIRYSQLSRCYHRYPFTGIDALVCHRRWTSGVRYLQFYAVPLGGKALQISSSAHKLFFINVLQMVPIDILAVEMRNTSHRRRTTKAKEICK